MYLIVSIPDLQKTGKVKPNKMIAILERTLNTAQQTKDQHQEPHKLWQTNEQWVNKDRINA